MGWVLDQLTLKRPNTMVMLTQLVVDALLVVYVIGAPFTLVIEGSRRQFQPIAIGGVFCLTLPLICTQTIIRLLDKPYGHTHDVYNVDAMLCGSEQCMFAELRARFEYDTLPILKLQRAYRRHAAAAASFRRQQAKIASSPKRAVEKLTRAVLDQGVQEQVPPGGEEEDEKVLYAALA